MYRLEELVSVLQTDEKKVLEALPVTGKEQKLLQLFLGADAPVELKDVCSRLDISETHFYKASSVLLTKCYEVLEKDPMKLLYFLREKGLYSHIRGAIRQQERELSKKEGEKLSSFYYERFHFLMDIPFRFSDEELLENTGKSWIEANGNHPADEAYVKYHLLLFRLSKNAADFKPENGNLINPASLREDEKKFIQNDWKLPLYYLYRCKAAHFSYYQSDPEKLIESLSKAESLLPALRDKFNFDAGLLVRLLLADAHFTGGNFDEARKIYRENLPELKSPSFAGYYYHYEQYILLLLISEEFEAAKTLLQKVFNEPIRTQNDIYATRGLITWCKYHLSLGEFPEAIRALRTASQLNEKTFYLPFDIQIRTLEMIYFLLKGENDFARQLGSKNMKLLRSKKGNQQFSRYASAWRLLIEASSNDQDLPEDEMLEVNKWFVNIYGNLLPLTLENRTSG